MKFKKLLGIFFFLTLITTTVFGSLAENSRQGFDGIFTGLHQGVTLSKAATAPGLSACFLESSRQVFLLGQGGTFGANTLGAAQARILQSGGNKVTQGTANALNKLLGESLPSREWGRAIEALKKAEGYDPNYHGIINSTGDYLTKEGKLIGNLLEFLK